MAGLVNNVSKEAVKADTAEKVLFDELIKNETPQSFDEVIDELDATANPRGSRETGSSSKRVERYEQWIENPAETAARRSHAQKEFQDFINAGFMPPRTQVRTARIQRTTAGRAHQAATARQGISQVPEFEPYFTLPNGIHFQPDDIIQEGASGYRFGDHKTLLEREQSFYLTETGEQQLRNRFQRDLEIYHYTRDHGCHGWMYSTDDPVLYKVLERIATEVGGGEMILTVIYK